MTTLDIINDTFWFSTRTWEVGTMMIFIVATYFLLYLVSFAMGYIFFDSKFERCAVTFITTMISAPLVLSGYVYISRVPDPKLFSVFLESKELKIMCLREAGEDMVYFTTSKRETSDIFFFFFLDDTVRLTPERANDLLKNIANKNPELCEHIKQRIVR